MGKDENIKQVNGLKLGGIFVHKGASYIAHFFPTRSRVNGHIEISQNGMPDYISVPLSQVTIMHNRQPEKPEPPEGWGSGGKVENEQ